MTGRMAEMWPVRLTGLEVAAGALTLRPVRLSDARRWSRTRIAEEPRLRPFEATVTERWADRHAAVRWPALCLSQRSAARRGVLIPLVIEVDGKYAGQITLGNIMRGPLQSAWIGYWVAGPFTGGGVATGAVAQLVDHAFGPMGLNRLEATVRPENTASRAVLTSAGFDEVGLIRRYMHVDGAWRDHLLTVTTADDHGEAAVARLLRSGRARWAG